MSNFSLNLPRIITGLLLFLVLACMRLSIFAEPFQPLQPLPSTSFVDLHCHTAGIGAGGSGCFVSEKMKHSYKFGLYLKAFGVTRKNVEAEGDALIVARISQQLAASQNVKQAVVLALDGVVDANGELDHAATEVYIPNEFLAAEVAKHANLLFGASVNPYRKDALQRLEWASTHGAVLVKWLPAIQHIDPSDEALIPFYKKLAELHLPLLTHTGDEHSFTQACDTFSDPERLRLPLRCGVTVIAAHAATSGQYAGEPGFDRLIRLMREYPNLYADISSLTQINKRNDLRLVLAQAECRDRLLYGTDFPLVAMPALISPWYYPFRLSFRQMRAIASVKNPWDRDVALKQALGVPTSVWTKFNELLPITTKTVIQPNPADRTPFPPSVSELHGAPA